MFDKERFHNTLALSLGYERIVNDKRFSINVDNSDDPWVTLKFLGCPEELRFKASYNTLKSEINHLPIEHDDIQFIVDAVHKAYQEACNSRF